MKDDKEFIQSLVKDIPVDEETASFLLKYLSAWLSNTGIDINSENIKRLNENKEIIDRLKIIYSKEKILDVIERKIILSDIAKGKLIIQQIRGSKDGLQYVNVEPSFNERIQAINALNALDAISPLEGNERIIIIDDIGDDDEQRTTTN